MIDHLIRYGDGVVSLLDAEAAAQADPTLAAYWHPGTDDTPGSWDTSRCLPGVQVWQPASDTDTPSTGPGGEPITVITHAYLPYWYIMVSLPEVDPALRDHPACMLVTDRHAASLGEAFVLYTPIPPDMLNTYVLAPCFAGSNYPFGNVVDP